MLQRALEETPRRVDYFRSDVDLVAVHRSAGLQGGRSWAVGETEEVQV